MGLSLYGDPDELDRLADRLRDRAAECRTCAEDHERQAGATAWHSVAADQCRQRIYEDRLAADQAAADLEHAAQVLRAHAQVVRERLALIARYEREITGWFDRAGSLIRRVASEVPWSGWPYSPQNLPPTGDLRWLDVGAFMQRQGVI
ncbi:hypothetical protein [Dactylosporangium sp. CA-139066]|uniref:hypothetical protein n=1 Tax=Dactylosporangium sp. CA-139066 TaxID=3239930 RepID=UPI003D8DB494